MHDGRIVAVGTDADALAAVGPRAEIVDLRGRLVLPGFIDGHTHLGNASLWAFEASVSGLREPAAVVDAVAAVAARIPRGLWIRGGDIGAAEAWEADARGAPRPTPMSLDRLALDRAAPDHPVVLRRVDGAYVANSLALARARHTDEEPDAVGGRKERDRTGRLTGVLHGRDGQQMVDLMPPTSLELQVVGARLALEELRRAGITSIHDVARLDAVSQRQLFHTHVERSATDLELFRELQRRGELTARVYAFLTLAVWRDIVAAGIRPRTDEGLIRYGALKAFIDGYLMEKPSAENGYAGDFTFRVVDEATMAADIVGADAAGFDPVVHVTGDKGHRLLLDWLEAAVRTNARRDRRFRVIHGWYPSPREIERIGALALTVDVTPQQQVNDVASAERRLGPERARTAHPWRSLVKAGARIDLVSDWPGRFGDRRPNPLAPLENIALAVGRTWHAEQALTVEEAIAAYTIAPAFASYEEDRKGSLSVGKLGDLVVLSRDILKLPADEIRATRVDLTILGGRVVHRVA